MEKKKESKCLVKVGKKEKTDYINAAFWALDKFGTAILRGLGGRQGKVMEIKTEVLSVGSVEEVYTEKKDVDGCAALEVKLERVGGEG